MPNAIELQAVTKRYGRTTVLQDVSAAIPAGQVIGLLGHNGAGKTTVIRLALGLISPTGGTVRTLGFQPDGRQARRLHARVGYLPENVAFYGNLTGREVIDYLARLKRVPPREAMALLHRVGLEAAADRRVGAYSKGMRQRLGLAQVLLGKPDMLVLDEPTTGLDPLVIQDFFDLVGELRAQGRTVIISSHLLAELEPHLDGALILRQGRVVAQGTIADMRQAARLPVTVSARLGGSCNGIFQAPWIRDLAAPPRSTGADTVEFDVPADRKIELLRQLVAVPGLADLTVKEPTLARLYDDVRRPGGRDRKA